MKKLAIASLALALTSLVITPNTARANDKGLAILGGFIGGVIVASALDHADHAPVYCPPSSHDGPRYGDQCGPAPRGYWKMITVKVWVPGYWIERPDHHGRRVRRYEGGHYTYRTERIWVAAGRGYDHNDRRW
jgi:hypothetical protein